MNTINNGRYEQFNLDVNAAVRAAKFLKVSIFNDDAGNSYVSDSNSNDIREQLISSISYLYPSVDETSGQQVNGSLTLSFAEGSNIVLYDDVDNFWYVVDGITNAPTPLK